MKIDRACFERGCACYDERIDKDPVEVVKREWVGLTDEDWRQIWAEFDASDVDFDFQEYMAKKHGAGYYTDPDGYWKFQQQAIKEMVNAKLKEKNT